MRRVRDPLNQLREICLVLPGEAEKTAWGERTFRVRGKMFAMCNGESHPGPLEVWAKARPEAQELLSRPTQGDTSCPLMWVTRGGSVCTSMSGSTGPW
jgi:predicted DNA-binding protein (MmcQ/YjbR family)